MRTVRSIGIGAALLAGVSALAADPAPSSTISQGDWARMLVARLGQASALRENAPPEEAAALLGARGVVIAAQGKSAKQVSADGTQRTWKYELDLPRTSTLLLTVGNSQPGFAGVDKGPSKLIAAGGPDGQSDA